MINKELITIEEDEQSSSDSSEEKATNYTGEVVLRADSAEIKQKYNFNFTGQLIIADDQHINLEILK